MRVIGLTTIVLVLVGAIAGCGGGGSSSSSAPESVSAGDLKQDAAFWLELEPPQRRELASICHDDAAKEASAETVLIVQELDVDDYVALMDNMYEHQGEDSASDIQEACEEAEQDLLRENFEELVPALREGAE
jgi:hypothetical protein